MVTVAVTGSSGKLGRHAVRELHSTVTGSSRSTGSRTRLARPMPAFGWS